MITYADLFTGFGGATIGAAQAGLKPSWGIDYDEKIVKASQVNHDHPIYNQSIIDIDFATLPKPDVLHLSPPCPSFSVAKNNGKETENDFILAEKCSNAIEILSPNIVTLENVRGYLGSKSLSIITNTLSKLGYSVDWRVINMADYGVPQKRLRLILWAIRGKAGAIIPPPPTTHSKEGSPPDLFSAGLPRWVSWYDAIEDLIPSLPAGKLAKWQIERLPPGLVGDCLISGESSKSNGEKQKEKESPSFTVSTSGSFLIMSQGNTSLKDAKPGRGWIGDKPAGTVGTGRGGGMPTMINGQQTVPGKNGGRVAMTTAGDRPATTISATSYKGLPVLVPPANTSSFNENALIDSERPSSTVMASTGSKVPLEKILLPGGNSGSFAPVAQNEPDRTSQSQRVIADRIMIKENATEKKRGHNETQVNAGGNPAGTVTPQSSRRRISERGQIKKLTPRCLARFQSFPDTFILPKSKSTAWRGIGNAVPPLFMKQLYLHLLEYIK